MLIHGQGVGGLLYITDDYIAISISATDEMTFPNMRRLETNCIVNAISWMWQTNKMMNMKPWTSHQEQLKMSKRKSD